MSESNSQKLVKLLTALGALEVTVGVNKEEGRKRKLVRRTNEFGTVFEESSDPRATVAAVAAWNEFGVNTASSNIPARPAIRNSASHPGVKSAAEALGRELATLENPAQLVTVAARFVQRMAEQTRRTVIEFNSPGNATATIAKKGFDDPLRDTGQYRNSITAEIALRGRRKAKVRPGSSDVG